jgi:citrate lyase subunit beta / citryl-CoA lyase
VPEPPGANEALLEGKAGLEGAVDRAAGGDVAEALELLVGEVLREPDLYLEPARVRLMIVGDVDRDVVDVPARAIGVEGDGRSDARRQGGRKELVRRGPGVDASQTERFVGDDPMVAIDDDLVAEAPSEPVGAGVKGHVPRLGGRTPRRIRGSCGPCCGKAAGAAKAHSGYCHAMRARRSALSVPGSSEKMLANAPGVPADEIVIDLEDAVAPTAKDDARQLVGRVLRDGIDAPGAVAVRVNGLDSGWCHRDVLELVGQAGAAIDSLVLPKVESADDVRWLDRFLGMLGEPASGIRLQALVETAGGLARAGEIAAASPRLEAVILGYADLAASLGRAGDEPERWLHAQEVVLVAARAAGVQAIDGPFLGIRDEQGLRLRAEHARALGFDGKWAVHPEQVPVLNELFTPAADELERAEAIVAALEGAGPGAVEVNGEMVDEASRKHAVQVLARGRAAGLRR